MIYAILELDPGDKDYVPQEFYDFLDTGKVLWFDLVSFNPSMVQDILEELEEYVQLLHVNNSSTPEGKQHLEAMRSISRRIAYYRKTMTLLPESGDDEIKELSDG